MKACAVILIVLLSSAAVPALPKYAASQGKPCASCHVNPSGGGLRTEEGIAFGRTALPVEAWQNDFQLAHLTNRIADFASVGADISTEYRRSEDGAKNVGESVDMTQANVYLNIDLAKYVSLCAKIGDDGKSEYFALANVLPASGSVKVGKFVPSYGLELEDEFSFVRSRLGLSWENGNPASTGLELNFTPGLFHFSGSLQNGPLLGTGTQIAGKAESVVPLTDESNLLIGADVLRRSASVSTTYGGFAIVRYRPVTLSGEADIVHVTGTNGLVTYAEGAVKVIQSLELFVSYDYFDPDIDFKSGSFSRYNFGTSFYPVQGIEFRGQYGILRDSESRANASEIRAQFHFYF